MADAIRVPKYGMPLSEMEISQSTVVKCRSNDTANVNLIPTTKFHLYIFVFKNILSSNTQNGPHFVIIHILKSWNSTERQSEP